MIAPPTVTCRHPIPDCYDNKEESSSSSASVAVCVSAVTSTRERGVNSTSVAMMMTGRDRLAVGVLLLMMYWQSAAQLQPGECGPGQGRGVVSVIQLYCMCRIQQYALVE